MKISKPFLIKSGLLFLLATFLGFFFATQSYLTYMYRNGKGDFWASASVTLPSWYIWAIFTPIIVWLARRFPLERSTWLRNSAIHLVLGLVVTVLKLLAVFQATSLVSWLPSLPLSIYQFHPTFLTYWVIVGLSHAIDYYRKFKERELRNSQLETRLAQAQLQVLKMQLQPHFLFNTLHAISMLMHKDVEKADRMMAKLSDLLRLTLDSGGVQEVPLKKELEFLDGYLEIEKTRFQDRLTIESRIEPETLDALVPNLILQPLVENAVRHGIEPHSVPGKIQIRTRRVNGMLEIKISDNGRGLKRNGSVKEGIGLTNTRARLQQLYGDNFRFNLDNSTSTGFVVEMSIPLKNTVNNAEGTDDQNHHC
ncbi:MAG: sensor histidine kinase [bacterium]